MTRWRRPASLQNRLLAGLTAVALGIGGLTAAVGLRRAGHELDELLDAHLAQAAALLVVQHAGPLAHDDAVVQDAPALHRYAPRVVFQVFHEGRIAVRSAEAPLAPLAPLADPGASGFSNVVRPEGAWRVFSARGSGADVTVLVGERLSARQEILWGVLGPLLALGGAALGLVLLLGAGVLRWGLAPLRRLRGELASRLAGQAEQLSPLALPGAPAELAPLVDTLNGLFSRIAALLEGERRLTADAAHELRTPIAAIRAQAQVALGADDDAERRHALAATLAGCDRAARLIDQLLMLARLEAGGAPPRAPLDLTELARRALAQAVGSAEHRSQVLSLDAPEPVRAFGDAVLAEVLLRNLLDNALRYTPPGTPVTLKLEVRPEGWQLHLDDGGPGLDAAAIAALGQRFRRGNESGAPGSGLGWSIVRRIAALLDWTAQVDRSPTLGGLRVRLGAAGDLSTAPS